MGAQIAKNEVVAAKRRAWCTIYADGYLLADRGTDFMSLGIVWIGQSSGALIAAQGTMTNVRHAFAPDNDVVESADTDAETLTLTGHEYETGDGPFVADEDLGTITAGNDFWIIAVDANKIAIAASLEDAYSDTRVELAGTETGATISKQDDTTRGIDGRFIYEFTQAETNVDGSELVICVEGPGYRFKNGGGTITTVALISSAASVWAESAGPNELGATMGDLLRGVARTHMAPREKNGATETTKSLDGAKDSHSGTISGSGRVVTIHDLT